MPQRELLGRPRGTQSRIPIHLPRPKITQSHTWLHGEHSGPAPRPPEWPPRPHGSVQYWAFSGQLNHVRHWWAHSLTGPFRDARQEGRAGRTQGGPQAGSGIPLVLGHLETSLMPLY